MPSALRQIKLKLKDLELEEACLVSKKTTWLIGFSPEVMLGLDKFSYTQVSITPTFRSGWSLPLPLALCLSFNPDQVSQSNLVD